MTWTALHESAVEALTAYTPEQADQRSLRAAYLAHLAAHADGHRKDGPPAHLTASLLVLDRAGEQVALTLHAKANRWFQFGGHLEVDDPDLAAAALREGEEESGLTGLELVGGIVELDRHDLEGSFGRCRTHLDVRFVAVCDHDAVAVSDESLAVAWWPVAALPNRELTTLVERGRRRLTGQG